MTELVNQQTEPPEEVREPAPLQPRIYVASVQDYDNGIDHGRWLDAQATPTELAAGVAEMLASSPSRGSDYAVQGTADFAGLRLGEHEPLDVIQRMAHAVVTYGSAFALWAESVGVTEASNDNFRNSYLGSWADLGAFGRDFAADLGFGRCSEVLREPLRWYVHINTEALVSDMLLTGEIDTFEDGVGVVHVFLAQETPDE